MPELDKEPAVAHFVLSVDEVAWMLTPKRRSCVLVVGSPEDVSGCALLQEFQRVRRHYAPCCAEAAQAPSMQGRIYVFGCISSLGSGQADRGLRSSCAFAHSVYKWSSREMLHASIIQCHSTEHHASFSCLLTSSYLSRGLAKFRTQPAWHQAQSFRSCLQLLSRSLAPTQHQANPTAL